MQNTQGSTTTTEMFYVITDHLVNETRLLQACAAKAVGRINPFGRSVWALANENGGFIENYAYDACFSFVETCAAGLATKRNPVQAGAQRRFRREGKRVNPTNWSLADTRTVFKTDRGFTLHEHYYAMQIINMVARMYDPLLGQFISVDPLYAKYPGVSAYTYCMNNPVAYWDPTGEDVYGLTDEGEIILLLVEEDKEDKLYSMEVCDDGTTSLGENIDLPDGTFENEIEVADLSNGDGLLGGQGTGYEIADKGVAADLFKFCADNSKVEFGLIETKNCGSVVMTNHNETSIAAGKTARKLYGSDYSGVIEITHYHPPRGVQGPSEGDMTNAGIVNRKNQDVNFNIYSRKYGYIPYNEFGVKATNEINIIGNKK